MRVWRSTTEPKYDVACDIILVKNKVNCIDYMFEKHNFFPNTMALCHRDSPMPVVTGLFFTATRFHING